MKKDQLLWCFIGALMAAGIAASFWPQGLHELQIEKKVFAAFSPPAPITALFVGDIMLDRTVATNAKVAGDDALFAGVRELFDNPDLRVGNLEGTITNSQSIAQADHSILRFTFDPHYAQLLADIGFNALSSANNHALDFGEDGYNQTRTYLTSAQIAPFGSPFNNEHIATSVTVGDKTLCLVGYMGLFSSDPTPVINKIKEIRPTCSYIVVMPHWGVEYQLQPTQAQVDFAHQFIDAGADVIIGSHPHVVEPLEIYKNKTIFYSLGNFIFDQSWRPEVKRGLTVEVAFGASETSFTLVPVNTYQEASVAGATTTKAVLEDVATSTLPDEIRNSILTTGSFELAK